MDLDAATLERIGQHLTDPDNYEPAPMPLYAAIAFLTPAAEIEASVCKMSSDSATVRWAVVWLTEDLIGFAQVEKEAAEWTADSPDQSPTDRVAWVRRLNDIIQLGAHSLNYKAVGPFGNRWASDVFPTIQWADGTDLALPLSEDQPAQRECEAIDRFAAMLRDKVFTTRPAGVSVPTI